METEERKRKRNAYTDVHAALVAIRDNTESPAVFDMCENALEQLEEFEPEQWYDDEDEEEDEDKTYKRQQGTQGYSNKAITEQEIELESYYGERYGY